jgi:hypothetical protein
MIIPSTTPQDNCNENICQPRLGGVLALKATAVEAKTLAINAYWSYICRTEN